RRSRGALLLRGAQQDLDVALLARPRAAREAALRCLVGAALGPHAAPVDEPRRARVVPAPRLARRLAHAAARPGRGLRGHARRPGRRRRVRESPTGEERPMSTTPFTLLLPVYAGDDPDF